MTRTPHVLIAAVLTAAFLGSCGDGTRPPDRRFAGTWAGPDSNRIGLATLMLDLAQSGDSVTGTAAMRPVNPSDGSCGSCHRSKDGAVKGTFDGTTLTLALAFAAGQSGDPTPACSIDVIAVLSERTDGSVAGTYTAEDPCEGSLQGVLRVSRSSLQLDTVIRHMRRTGRSPHP